MGAVHLIEAIDSIIAKATAVGTVAQIARLEVRLRKDLTNEWNTRAAQAASISTPMLLDSASADQVVARVNPVFSSWLPVVQERYLEGVKQAYELARKAGWDQATGQTKGSLQYSTPHVKTVEKAVPPEIANPVFDAVDTTAVKSLQNKELVWMGDMYSEGVQDSIRSSAQDVIEQGRGRAFSATQLKKHMLSAGQTIALPLGYTGSTSVYLEGTVANAVTVARVQGQLKSFSEFEVTQYYITNPDDERTCPVCGHMDGKTFSVKQGQKIAVQEIAAKTPDEVKAIHPWLSPDDLVDISPKAGDAGQKDSDALAKAGFALPPFHFRCFLEGTLVWCFDGLKRIEDVEVGDLVLTHKLRWKPVTKLLRNSHEGNIINIGSVSNTDDHPYLTRSGDGEIAWRPLERGDCVATVEKDYEDLCCVQYRISGHAIEAQDGLLERMHDRKQATSRKKIAQHKTSIVHRGQGFQALRGLRKKSKPRSIKGIRLQVLFGGMQSTRTNQRKKYRVHRMRKVLLAYSRIEKSRCQDMLDDLQMVALEKVGRWTKVWRKARHVLGLKQSDVRTFTRPREDHRCRFKPTREVQSKEHMGKRGCGLPGTTRYQIPVRAKKVQVTPWSHIRSRLVCARPRPVDRSERLDERSGSRNSIIVPGATYLYSTVRNEDIKFIPIKDLKRKKFSGIVYNLTVADDESYVVGSEGFIVHNCRCTVDAIV